VSFENTGAAAQGANAGGLLQMIELWRALAPARDKAGTIDWQKVLEFIRQMMPIVLALLDLLPKKA
jgi:hypothetical protein